MGILLGSSAQPLGCDVGEGADRVARLGHSRFVCAGAVYVGDSKNNRVLKLPVQ
jgi:hypothetical protein